MTNISMLHARKPSYLAAGIAILLAPLLMAQVDDTTPPTLRALSFSSGSVDVSAAAQTSIVTATVTDDLSGFWYGYITFTSPSGQTAMAYLNRVSGNNLNGMYQVSVPFPRYSEPGIWTASVYLRDNANNGITYSSAALAGDGLPGSLTVVDSNPDTTPPTLLSASFSPAAIDTSAGPQTITVSLQISDAQSGVTFTGFNYCGYAGLYRVGPGSSDYLYVEYGNFSLASGDTHNGVWRATLTMPQYSGGTWRISNVCLTDNASNIIRLTSTQLSAMGINPVLTDSSTPADTAAPTLTGLAFVPAVIYTSSSSQTVNLMVSASDDISGVFFGLFNNTYSYNNAVFQSPSGNQTVYSQAIYNNPAPVAGTPLSGTW